MDKNEKLVEWLTQAAQRGGEFVEREAPQYAAEVVEWHFWGGLAGVITGVLLALAGIALWRYGLWVFYTKAEKESWDEARSRQECGGYCTIAGMALAILSIVPIGVNAHAMLKASVAPRVVIVEALAGHAGK